MQRHKTLPKGGPFLLVKNNGKALIIREKEEKEKKYEKSLQIKRISSDLLDAWYPQRAPYTPFWGGKQAGCPASLGPVPHQVPTTIAYY